MTDQQPRGEESTEPEPTFSEQLSAAMRQSSLGKIDPNEAPTVSGLLSVVGGIRGLIESFLPGLIFLIVFTITGDRVISVIIPIGVAIALIAARALMRQPLTPAVSGAIGIALTAALSLLTQNVDNNFLPGIIINSVMIVVLVVSLIVRWPLVGVIVGLLMSDTAWRDDPLKYRAFVFATIVWIIPSAVRVGVQVPLYLASLTELLAGSKLLTGLPLYAAALWLTWMLVRRVYPNSEKPVPTDEPAPSDPA